MSGFDALWLDLRERYDAAARDRGLERRLRDAIAAAATDGPVVDLGAGTGSNLRHLAPLLGTEHPWLLVDDDDALLAAAGPRIARWALDGRAPLGERAGAATTAPAFGTRQLDLAADLHAVDLAGASLVSAAALLDLVSREWVDALAARCARNRVPALLVLSYDGRIEWVPEDRGDEEVRLALNAHQRTDKGFGPALGPCAGGVAARAFAASGHVVHTARSDWVLGPEDAALQRALIEGWVRAALEVEPARGSALRAWLERRHRRLDAGASRLLVGHVDLLALPP